MDKPSFEASLRALARRRAQEGHPEPSELAAYHTGELTEDQEEKIQDHLAICEECARMLLGFSEYSQFQPVKNTDAAADAEAWQRFQARLREEERPATTPREEAPSAPVLPLQRRQTPLLQRPGLAWAVAAGLALCVVGLGIRNMTPPAPPAEQSELEFKHYVPLARSEVKRGGAEAEETEVVTIDPLVEEVDFEIPLDEPTLEATYEVVLFAAEQDEPLRTGTKQDSGEYLVVGVPRSILVPGAYRFEVRRNEENGSRPLVGTYSFNVP